MAAIMAGVRTVGTHRKTITVFPATLTVPKSVTEAMSVSAGSSEWGGDPMSDESGR